MFGFRLRFVRVLIGILPLASYCGIPARTAVAQPRLDPSVEATIAEPPPVVAEDGALLRGPSHPLGGGTLQALPANHLYERYLADPRQPMMKALVFHMLRHDTPETDSPQLEFTMGGSYGLLRWHPRGEPDLGWQLETHAAFLGRFDARANFDAIGWDGLYGLTFSHRPLQQLAFKLAYQHDSAHVADEYIRKTGRKRITYTREEAALGVVFDPLPWIRAYLEAGWGFDLAFKGMRPWRGQVGVELRHGILYAAADLNFWQERRWRPTTTVQVGVMTQRPATGRRYGATLQFANGRTTLGEFFEYEERTLGLGWWVDL